MVWWLVFCGFLNSFAKFKKRQDLEPINEYTEYLLVEIWIRPTITYGLVACFVTETEK